MATPKSKKNPYAKNPKIIDPITGEERHMFNKELDLTPKQERFLRKLYYEDMHIHGVKRLFDVVRRKAKEAGIPHIYQLQVQRWLEKQEVYQLHRQAPKFKSTRQIYSRIPGSLVQLDLIDFSQGRTYRGYTHLLTCIDVATRKAWVVPLKGNKADTTSREMTALFKSMQRKPSVYSTDNGAEFAYDLPGLAHIRGRAETPTNQSMIERFNKTIKHMYFKYFEATGDRNWPVAMLKLTENYNDTGKKQFGYLSPNDLYAMDDIADVQAQSHARIQKYLSKQKSKERVDKPIPVGSWVRIIEPDKKIKPKGEPKWSRNVYEVLDARKAQGYGRMSYKVQNVLEHNGSRPPPELGRFNSTQLQVIPKIIEQYESTHTVHTAKRGTTTKEPRRKSKAKQWDGTVRKKSRRS